MHFLKCDRPQSPKSSEPTIPLILRGKKKQFRKRKQQQSPPKLPEPKITIQPHNTIMQRHLITHVHRPPIIHHRSVSVPRNITIYRPIINGVPSPVRVLSPPRSLAIQNPHRLMRNTKGDQIRRNLDQNLHKIYRTLNQRRLSFDVQNNKIHNSIELSGPKLQQNLVQQYIKLIYQDYNIRDPLHSSSIGINRNSISADSATTEPNRRIDTNKKRGQSILNGSTNRKAVQLKESFLIQMFSPAEDSSQGDNQNLNKQFTNSKSRKDSQKNRHTSDVNTFVHSGQLAQITQMCEKEVGQTYRYCFVCQQPILQVNIDIHERQRCPEFCNLYDMSLSEIKTALIRKILRLKQQCEYNYDIVFGNQHEKQIKLKLQNLRRQTKRYLAVVDTNAKCMDSVKPADKLKAGQCLISKNQLKSHFSNVMDCYQENYFKLYQNLRKLQWFSVMLKNLEQKYYSLSLKNQDRNSIPQGNNRIYSLRSQDLSNKFLPKAY